MAELFGMSQLNYSNRPVQRFLISKNKKQRHIEWKEFLKLTQFAPWSKYWNILTARFLTCSILSLPPWTTDMQTYKKSVPDWCSSRTEYLSSTEFDPQENKGKKNHFLSEKSNLFLSLLVFIPFKTHVTYAPGTVCEQSIA